MSSEILIKQCLKLRIIMILKPLVNELSKPVCNDYSLTHKVCSLTHKVCSLTQVRGCILDYHSLNLVKLASLNLCMLRIGLPIHDLRTLEELSHTGPLFPRLLLLSELGALMRVTLRHVATQCLSLHEVSVSAYWACV